jgi:hypothetical protein
MFAQDTDGLVAIHDPKVGWRAPLCYRFCQFGLRRRRRLWGFRCGRGRLRGKIVVPEDFDAPLPDDVLVDSEDRS